MLELFPDTADVERGALRIGGVAADDLADAHGTPLLVLCEATPRTRARAYRAATPEALVVYGTKAFPNVAVMRLLAEEGLGADVSTLGEVRFARRAGIGGERLVLHGNNKSDEELAEAAALGAVVVLDAPDELERAAAAGVSRLLVRVTAGIEADTHAAIRTGHHGSKFGLPPDDALAAIGRSRPLGLHVHVGSQLVDAAAARMTIEWLAAFAAECERELGWTPELVDLGGGLGVRTSPEDAPPPAIADFAGALLEAVEHAWSLHRLPRPRLVLEPGRSLVGPAGVTLYRVGSVKRARASVAYVAVDGGMSDNPRPQLYAASGASARLAAGTTPAQAEVTIVQTAQSAGGFKTLLALATKAKLAGTLQSPGPYTVLAPTDAAFRKVPKATLRAVQKDPKLLRRVLLYHVIKGNVPSSTVVTLKSAKTLAGPAVKIRVAGNRVFVNTSRVTTVDVAASNGVIHVIDRVLIPPKH